MRKAAIFLLTLCLVGCRMVDVGAQDTTPATANTTPEPVSTPSPTPVPNTPAETPPPTPTTTSTPAATQTPTSTPTTPTTPPSPQTPTGTDLATSAPNPPPPQNSPPPPPPTSARPLPDGVQYCSQVPSTPTYCQKVGGLACGRTTEGQTVEFIQNPGNSCTQSYSCDSTSVCATLGPMGSPTFCYKTAPRQCFSDTNGKSAAPPVLSPLPALSSNGGPSGSPGGLSPAVGPGTEIDRIQLCTTFKYLSGSDTSFKLSASGCGVPEIEPFVIQYGPDQFITSTASTGETVTLQHGQIISNSATNNQSSGRRKLMGAYTGGADTASVSVTVTACGKPAQGATVKGDDPAYLDSLTEGPIGTYRGQVVSPTTRQDICRRIVEVAAVACALESAVNKLPSPAAILAAGILIPGGGYAVVAAYVVAKIACIKLNYEDQKDGAKQLCSDLSKIGTVEVTAALAGYQTSKINLTGDPAAGYSASLDLKPIKSCDATPVPASKSRKTGAVCYFWVCSPGASQFANCLEYGKDIGLDSDCYSSTDPLTGENHFAYIDDGPCNNYKEVCK